MNWRWLVLIGIFLATIFGLYNYMGASTSATQSELGQVMTAKAAHAKALAGEVVLVDIRRPEEWLQSGLPASGHAITMHQDTGQFIRQLKAIAGQNVDRPIALICATGGRSTGIQPELKKAGLSNLVNVAEGMIGGRFGPGWLKSGLPTRPGTRHSSAPTMPVGSQSQTVNSK